MNANSGLVAREVYLAEVPIRHTGESDQRSINHKNFVASVFLLTGFRLFGRNDRELIPVIPNECEESFGDIYQESKISSAAARHALRSK